jgi:hypothetical protein
MGCFLGDARVMSQKFPFLILPCSSLRFIFSGQEMDELLGRPANVEAEHQWRVVFQGQLGHDDHWTTLTSTELLWGGNESRILHWMRVSRDYYRDRIKGEMRFLVNAECRWKWIMPKNKMTDILESNKGGIPADHN